MAKMPKIVWIAGLAVIVIAIFCAVAVFYYPRWQDDRAFSRAEQQAQAAGADNQSALMAYQTYLDDYSEGHHSVEATTKKHDLEIRIDNDADNDAFSQAEQQAQAAGTDKQTALNSYQAYLKRYPRGLHSSEVKSKVNDLGQALLSQAQTAEQTFAAGGRIFLFNPLEETSDWPGTSQYSVGYILADGTSDSPGELMTQMVFIDGSMDDPTPADEWINNINRLTFSEVTDIKAYMDEQNQRMGSVMPEVPSFSVEWHSGSSHVLVFVNNNNQQLVSNILSIQL